MMKSYGRVPHLAKCHIRPLFVLLLVCCLATAVAAATATTGSFWSYGYNGGAATTWLSRGGMIGYSVSTGQYPGGMWVHGYSWGSATIWMDMDPDEAYIDCPAYYRALI